MLYDKFKLVLGEPTSDHALLEYLSFCENKETDRCDVYCELHHVLPSCIEKNDYVVRLTYEDHVTAHVLLAKAYPIRKLITPLMWMKKYVKDVDFVSFREAYGDIISKGWTNETRQRQSERMRSLSKEEYSRRSLLAHTNRDKEAFRKKMTEVNSDPDKIKRVSESLKNAWKRPEVVEKMKSRATRGKSSKDKDKWMDAEFKEKTLKSRRKIFLSKKLNKPVDDNNLAECELLYQNTKKKLNSTQLNSRDEVKILAKYYALEKKVTGNPITKGYYRKSTSHLLNEIERIKNTYGEIDESN